MLEFQADPTKMRRWQSVFLIAKGCEPGQIRKEAAATSKSSIKPGLAGTVSSCVHVEDIENA